MHTLDDLHLPTHLLQFSTLLTFRADVGLIQETGGTLNTHSVVIDFFSFSFSKCSRSDSTYFARKRHRPCLGVFYLLHWPEAIFWEDSEFCSAFREIRRISGDSESFVWLQGHTWLLQAKSPEIPDEPACRQRRSHPQDFPDHLCFSCWTQECNCLMSPELSQKLVEPSFSVC